jgi:hypothetical protein
MIMIMISTIIITTTAAATTTCRLLSTRVLRRSITTDEPSNQK